MLPCKLMLIYAFVTAGLYVNTGVSGLNCTHTLLFLSHYLQDLFYTRIYERKQYFIMHVMSIYLYSKCILYHLLTHNSSIG